MKSNLTLPQIHQRSKRQSISQKWQSSQYPRKQDPYKLIQSKLQAHRQQLQKNNATISQLTENFELVRGELLREQQLNEELTSNNKKLREEVERVTRQMKGIKGKWEELDRQVAREKEEYERVIQGLRGSMVQGSREEESKIKRQEEEIGGFKKQNSRLVSEMKVLKQQYEKREKQAIQRNLQQKESLMKQLQASKRALQQQQMKFKALEGNKIAHIQLEKKISELYEQLRVRDNQLQARNTQITSLKDSRREIDGQLDRTKKNAASKTKQLQGLQVKLLEIQQKLGNLSKQKDELEAKLKQTELTSLSLKTQLAKASQQLVSAQEQVKKYIPAQVKLLDLLKISGRLDQSQKQVQNSVQCTFCKEILKEPVTVIPCGHCFCLACKKGYQKQCCKCGPKVKIDALYRNELMDQIINMLKIARSISSMLNGTTGQAQK